MGSTSSQISPTTETATETATENTERSPLEEYTKGLKAFTLKVQTENYSISERIQPIIFVKPEKPVKPTIEPIITAKQEDKTTDIITKHFGF